VEDENNVLAQAKQDVRRDVETVIAEVEEIFFRQDRPMSRRTIIRILRSNLDLAAFYAERNRLVTIETPDDHVALHAAVEVIKEIFNEIEQSSQN
jgi:hypothetical protein